MSIQDIERMKEFGLGLLVQMSIDLLNDMLPKAKEAARTLLISIYNAYTENEEHKEESWQNFCQSSLPTIYAQSLAKITSSQ